MDEKVAGEIEKIRQLQSDLRWRLDALDRRIEALQEQPAADSFQPPAVLSVPPPPQPAPQEPEPAAPLVSEVIPPPLPQEEVVVASPDKNQPKAAADSLELRVGRFWLVKIGIVILLTGLVFLGMEFITRLGPLGKLMLIYLAGFGLGGVGWVIKRRYAEAEAYGKVLIGGGIATCYYATYAAHFVEPLRVIASPFIGGAALLALAAGIIWLADRLRSQSIAAATVILGFYTGAINPIASFSLFSNLVLSVMAIALLMRQRWHMVSFLSLVGCYAAFAFWRVQATGSLIVIHAPPELFWTAVLFPACYWAVFTVATFLGRDKGMEKELLPTFLTLNNGAFFALVSPTIAGTYPDKFWLFALVLGGLLVGLSWMAAKRNEQDLDTAYLTQGLTLVFLAVVLKFSGYQLALMLALSSLALMRMSQYRQGVILQIFSGIGAALATTFAMFNLFAGKPYATLTAVTVAVLLTATAWIFKYHRGLLKPLSFQWRAMALTALAMGLGVAAIWQGIGGSEAFYYFVGLALVGTGSVYLLRMPELVFAAQGVAAVAVFQWFMRLIFRGFENYSAITPFVVIVVALLALMHWWQHQRIYALENFWRITWQALHAAAIVAVGLAWTVDQIAQPNLTFAMALMALILLSYSYITRALPLGIGSQVFTAVAAAGLLMFYGENSWPIVLATLVTLFIQSMVIEFSSRRSSESFGAFSRQYSLLLRTVTFLLTLVFIEKYTPVMLQFSVLTVAAFICFSVGAWTRKPEPLYYTLIAIILGYWEFASNNLVGNPVFAPNLAGLGLILLAQQVGKRRLQVTNVFGPEIQSALITAGVLGIWLMTHRLVAGVESGFLITVSWSLLAFAVLAAGFLLSERTYRLLGLGILAVAIGRLFLIDVWQLEKIFRNLSFVILGLVLLVLGFLYNRFADKIRKWI